MKVISLDLPFFDLFISGRKKWFMKAEIDQLIGKKNSNNL